MTEKTKAGPRRLLSLEIENVLRVRCVRLEFDPKGGLTIIGGRNGAGKTSTLKALEYVFAGKRALGDEPLRRGATKGHVIVELDDMTVRRDFSRKGRTDLKVEAKDGTRFASPQAMLERLVDHFAFDPLAFTNLPPAKQADWLRELLGIDFTELDAKRETHYTQRTMMGRDRDSLKGQLDGLPFHEDVPEEPVVVTELIGKRDKLSELNVENAVQRTRLKHLSGAGEVAVKGIADRTADVAAAANALHRAKAQLSKTIEQAQELQENIAVEQQKVDRLVDHDLTGITTAIEKVEQTNALVRANEARDNVTKRYLEADKAYGELSNSIAKIDRIKAELLAKADFPIPGLGFSEIGLTLNGFEFSAAGGAEQLEVAMAIGIRAAGDLRLVTIDKGEQLDAKSLEIVRKMADDAGAYVLMSRVSEGDECTVIIEDGEIKEPSQEAPA